MFIFAENPTKSGPLWLRRKLTRPDLMQTVIIIIILSIFSYCREEYKRIYLTAEAWIIIIIIIIIFFFFFWEN